MHAGAQLYACMEQLLLLLLLLVVDALMPV
jgi:hypothetical protein